MGLSSDACAVTSFLLDSLWLGMHARPRFCSLMSWWLSLSIKSRILHDNKASLSFIIYGVCLIMWLCETT